MDRMDFLDLSLDRSAGGALYLQLTSSLAGAISAGSLPAGARLSGPVVVEELDSTTVVHPGYTVHADEHAHLIVEREGT